jgi:subtilisin family serine protease
MEMLILRRKSGKLAGDADVAPGAAPAVEVLVLDLPPSELNHLQRDEDVLGAAASMPLSLIRPVASPAGSPDASGAAGGGPDGVAWGVEAIGASGSPFTGKGVTVAVLDTGIQKDHSAFAGVNIVGRNFTAGPADDIADVDGHGTHCAGTIFGRAVDGTRIGVAPGVTRALIGKVLGPGGGSTVKLWEAINWAVAEGAAVVSMSLGIDLVGYRQQLEADGMHPEQATSTAMRALVDNVRLFDKLGNLLRSGAAFGRSTLIVAASGNKSDRFANPSYVLDAEYPAAAEDFVCVGALERTGDATRPFRTAAFSNARAMFAAPGVDIVSAALGGGLRSLSGTSMATPHVSGVAILWAEKLMSGGPTDARKLLDRLKAATRVSPGLEESDVGFGMPQAPRK